MAIDSAQKRRSMMLRGMPWRTQSLPFPSGSITTLDKHQRLYRYTHLWAISTLPSVGVIIDSVLMKSQIQITTEIKEQIQLTTSIE